MKEAKQLRDNIVEVCVMGKGLRSVVRFTNAGYIWGVWVTSGKGKSYIEGGHRSGSKWQAK